MNIYSDNTQKYNSQSVANNVSQNQKSSGSKFHFVDNRVEAIQMRKLQEMANNHAQKSNFQLAKQQSVAIAQRKLEKTVGNKMIVSQLMENGEKGLDAQKTQLEQEKEAIGQVSLDDFRKELEKKIRAFAKSEYEEYGGDYSYTPWYKDNKISAWKRIAYRMCEDRRLNNEPGHVSVTKAELETNLNIQCEQERVRRNNQTQKINGSLRDVIQR